MTVVDPAAATIAMAPVVAPEVAVEVLAAALEAVIAGVDHVTEAVLQCPGEGKIISLPLSLSRSGTTSYYYFRYPYYLSNARYSPCTKYVFP